MTALAELSYQAALRLLDLQERSLAELRQRTATLLAASSLTASFLGGQAVSRSVHVGVLHLLAIVALGISVGFALYVLWPKPRIVFGLSAPLMFLSLGAVALDEELRRRLAYWLEDLHVANNELLDLMNACFAGAVIALVLQFVLWTWALLGTV